LLLPLLPESEIGVREGITLALVELRLDIFLSINCIQMLTDVCKFTIY
jgi:hypothetical protein